MAEPKITSKKTKRSSGPSTTAKPEDGVIEGAAVEKPTAAQSAGPFNNPAKSQNRPSTDQNRRRSTMRASQNVAVVMAGIAVVLALIALAVSLVIYQQTAYETSSGRPAASAALNGFDQVGPDKFSRRLDSLARLIAQNADQFESMQQELASATAARFSLFLRGGVHNCQSDP